MGPGPWPLGLPAHPWQAQRFERRNPGRMVLDTPEPVQCNGHALGRARIAASSQEKQDHGNYCSADARLPPGSRGKHLVSSGVRR